MDEITPAREMRTREWKEGLFRSSSRKRRFGNFYLFFFLQRRLSASNPRLDIWRTRSQGKKKASVSRGVRFFRPTDNVFLIISILELQFTTRKKSVSTPWIFLFLFLSSFCREIHSSLKMGKISLLPFFVGGEEGVDRFQREKGIEKNEGGGRIRKPIGLNKWRIFKRRPSLAPLLFPFTRINCFTWKLRFSN